MDRRNSNSSYILNKHFPGLMLRLWDTFAWEIGLSALCAMLFYFNLLPNNVRAITILTVVCMIISLVHTYLCLTDYRHTFKRKKVYFKVNMAAWSIFTLVNLTMALWNKEPVYTWLFFQYKLLNIYTQASPFVIAKVVSAAIMSLPMLMCIIFVWLIKRPKSRKHLKRVNRKR